METEDDVGSKEMKVSVEKEKRFEESIGNVPDESED